MILWGEKKTEAAVDKSTTISTPTFLRITEG